MADRWSQWLLDRRFGGDAQSAGARRSLNGLVRVRDSLLDFVRVKEGETVLDVGCGDGLMAFGALERAGAHGRAILLDISSELLDRSREIARDTGVADRCAFVRACADRLPLRDQSVDLITTRSVLIYVKDKDAALAEFRRVLRSAGRIALFETVLAPEFWNPDRIWPGFGMSRFTKSEIEPVRELIDRLIIHFASFRNDTASMVAFGHKEWFAELERAGFPGIRVDMSVSQGPSPSTAWEQLLNSSLNPLVPTLAESMGAIFTPEERHRLEEHVRPWVERGGAIAQMAHVMIWAWKTTPNPEEPE